MKILLTGATGFLGSHLSRRLVNDGHEVNAIRRMSSSLSRVQDIANKIAWFMVKPNGVIDSSAFDDVDAIIHTATAYGRKGEATAELANTNTLIPLTLLEAAIHHGIRCFINTDSALPPNTNAYSLSKAQFAQWGQFIAARDKIQFINVRLEHIYGPDDDETKFTYYVINACLKNQMKLSLTEGLQSRDFIYISDVVEAYLVLINQCENNLADFSDIPLGSGTATTIRYLVETIHKLTNSSTQLLFGELPLKPGEVMYSRADLSIMKGLGWTPSTELSEGLELTIRSARQS